MFTVQWDTERVPDATLTEPEIRVAQRLLRVAEPHESGCLLVLRGLNESGYCMASVYDRTTKKAKQQRGHRLVYRLLVGPIPDGWHVDHVYARGCRHRNCIAIEHLEVVTPGENHARSGADGGVLYEPPTTCSAGHPYLPSVAQGRQVECYACRLQTKRKWKAKARSGAASRARCSECCEDIALRSRKTGRLYEHRAPDGVRWCQGRADTSEQRTAAA